MDFEQEMARRAAAANASHERERSEQQQGEMAVAEAERDFIHHFNEMVPYLSGKGIRPRQAVVGGKQGFFSSKKMSPPGYVDTYGRGLYNGVIAESILPDGTFWKLSTHPGIREDTVTPAFTATRSTEVFGGFRFGFEGTGAQTRPVVEEFSAADPPAPRFSLNEVFLSFVERIVFNHRESLDGFRRQ